MPSIAARENVQVRFRYDCEIDTGAPIEFAQGKISSRSLQVYNAWRFLERPRRIFEDKEFRAVIRPYGRHHISKTIAAIHLARRQRGEVSRQTNDGGGSKRAQTVAQMQNHFIATDGGDQQIQMTVGIEITRDQEICICHGGVHPSRRHKLGNGRIADCPFRFC